MVTSGLAILPPPFTGALPGAHWLLELYVAGKTPKSVLALQNLTMICKKELAGRHAIEVIDLEANSAQVMANQIIAIPTVIQRWPEPVLQVVGTLSDTAKALAGLGLRMAADRYRRIDSPLRRDRR
jgi:circadian clock protein KaiB